MMHSYMFMRGDDSKIPMNLIGDRLQPGTDKFCIQILYRKVPVNDLLSNHTFDLLLGNSVVSSVYLIDRKKLLSPVEGPVVLFRLLKHAGVPAGSPVMRSLIRGIVEYARVLVLRVEGRDEPEEGKVYHPVLPIVLGIVEGHNNGVDHARRPPPLPRYSGHQLQWSNGIRRRIIRF